MRALTAFGLITLCFIIASDVKVAMADGPQSVLATEPILTRFEDVPLDSLNKSKNEAAAEELTPEAVPINAPVAGDAARFHSADATPIELDPKPTKVLDPLLDPTAELSDSEFESLITRETSLTTTSLNANEKPTSTPDVSQPIPDEIVTSSSQPQPHFGLPFETESAPPGIAYGGYDGLVDQYVYQLLNGCGATPGAIPAVSSLKACGPNLQGCDVSVTPTSTSWYGQAHYLVLQPWGRDDREISIDNPFTPAVLNLSDVQADWSPGAEIRVGVRTGLSAIEFGWWSMFADRQSASATSPTSDLTSLIDFSQIDIDFNGALLHQLQSELEVHNFDLTKRHILSDVSTSNLQFAYSYGLRFTRISEDQLLQADTADTILDGSLGELTHSILVDNRLFGAELGGTVHWDVTPSLAFAIDAKAGVFYNYMDHEQTASDLTGPSVVTGGPDIGELFGIDARDEQAAVLSELRLNGLYALTERLRLSVGYRAFAAAGIATASGQIPARFGALRARGIDGSDSLLLHGFHFGLDGTF